MYFPQAASTGPRYMRHHKTDDGKYTGVSLRFPRRLGTGSSLTLGMTASVLDRYLPPAQLTWPGVRTWAQFAAKQ